MNNTNYMPIICISFVLMGIGVRITTLLYLTAYEEISNDKIGIASRIQNSTRQLTTCIAIALLSTLSVHYTFAAVDHTKTAMISEVNDSDVLDQSVKDEFINAVGSSSGLVSTDDSKEMVHTLLSAKVKSVLATLSKDQQSAVTESFRVQETEIDSILEHIAVVKENESYKVYNKCFMIIGIIALFGMIAVPFNHKRLEIIDII